MPSAPTVGVLSVRQVAARAQIPRSTAHELCRTLAREGMLEDSGHGYQLGPLILELAGQIIERTGLVRAAEGILDRLVRAPEQEAHLGQLLQGWIVYVDRNSSTRNVAMFNRVGQRAPAHLTGCGKAALCWLPFDKVVGARREMLRRRRTFGSELGGTRSRAQSRQAERLHHFSVISERSDVGCRGHLGSSGHPLGGVSVAGPATMFTPAVLAAARASGH